MLRNGIHRESNSCFPKSLAATPSSSPNGDVEKKPMRLPRVSNDKQLHVEKADVEALCKIGLTLKRNMRHHNTQMQTSSRSIYHTRTTTQHRINRLSPLLCLNATFRVFLYRPFLSASFFVARFACARARYTTTRLHNPYHDTTTLHHNVRTTLRKQFAANNCNGVASEGH